MSQVYKIQHQLQLINAIKDNDSLALKEFYMANYPKIEQLILKNSGSKAHAKDIYQEAFIAVWNNLRTGRFAPENDSALQGYLYQISKNKWLDVLRSKRFKSTQSLTEERSLFLSQDEETHEDPEETKRLNLAMEAFKNLGEPCKSLLKTFYFEQKSLRDIASEMAIEESSVRNKKYRCMEKLRSIVLASN
ncbi:sigma-70 family RNA polymerase sigma factor [Subsaximicrobium wynnwilliamsii]|uniref:Sigma-70 family RNA polymerase sigma factor n=1 Tax=Subsaximicrobium wynnwilliamsii TaxID=291179 RepID=A0A5C6ZK89_9FLAO|nr:sigma-70 family RNA polymerase sigma factor [Subsaximicrobium wynnwilliamsii]TXD83834.1 sigma-70 family RNA polymerase sigma factor [Subsaximicrobium wynnwilliamsii]TXD89575.1 sigma-70 family RNA polymerase sigma factor [Subsaximicrobium wynnwilliamsii]TXE02634.1 sigma-70 family RNA polymerase sigma factor [Subsaximicrobium wynnwilliamsii]